MKHISTLGAAGILTTLALTTPLAAQPATGAEPVALVSAKSVGRDGNVVGWARGTHPMNVGRRTTGYKFAGSITRGDLAGCSAGGSEDGVKTLDALVAEHPYVWKITTTAQKSEEGRIVLDLEWERYANATGVKPVASGQQRLSLAEGERYTIDLLHVPADAGCGISATVIDVEAGVRDDVALRDQVIAYDLWLVHTDPAGRKQSRRLSSSGLHGMQVPFGFGALRFGAPKLAADQYDFDVVTRVAGHLRGRMQKDGRIQVELLTTRRDGLERVGAGDPPQIPGGQGRKLLSVAPGEAVEIELPAGGMSGSYASDAAAAAAKGSQTTMGLRGGRGAPGTAASSDEAVSIVNGRYTVRYKPFFEGHRVVLIVQARKGADSQ